MNRYYIIPTNVLLEISAYKFKITLFQQCRQEGPTLYKFEF